MAKIIDGKYYANKIKEITKDKIKNLDLGNENINLTVIKVGDDPASSVYVRNKEKACAEVGIRTTTINLPASISEEELLKVIDEENDDSFVNGILVQLPLPSHIDEDTVINHIDPLKDVDCFHPINVGKLTIGDPLFIPCTPYGILYMLQNETEIKGKHVVIIGRSNIVGKPLALLLTKYDATVTLCHSKTENIKDITKTADILIVAAGKEKLVDASYIKEDTIVIDVGIHRDANNKLCGDVDFESVEPIVSAITPVPGGVGPMTIAMLLTNCYVAYCAQNK